MLIFYTLHSTVSLPPQDIRASLRGRAVVLMGKNTLIKKCVRMYMERTGDEKWEVLLEHLVGNVGIIFTAEDLGAIREEVLKFKMPAPAKAGVVAPVSVTVPAGNTGLDPSSTSFFQVSTLYFVLYFVVFSVSSVLINRTYISIVYPWL